MRTRPSASTTEDRRSSAPLAGRAAVREDGGPGEVPRATGPAADAASRNETPHAITAAGAPEPLSDTTALRRADSQRASGAEPANHGVGRHCRPVHQRTRRGLSLVPLGRVLATPAALRAVADARENPADYLARHMTGDWGELDAEDWAANDRALAAGERLLSVYRLPTGERFWLITEADRSSTILLVPSDY